MSTMQLIALFIMAAFYIYAGVMHFKNPPFFLKITPKWVPNPERVNLIVGGIEIILGLALLFPYTRSYAAIGVILLLIAVFPANVYHFQQARKKNKLVLVTTIRLPIQLLLMYWAYTYI